MNLMDFRKLFVSNLEVKSLLFENDAIKFGTVDSFVKPPIKTQDTVFFRKTATALCFMFIVDQLKSAKARSLLPLSLFSLSLFRWNFSFSAFVERFDKVG